MVGYELDGRLYRYGERGPLARLVMEPREGLLEAGVTVGDLLLVLATVPVLYMWVWLMAVLFSPVPI